MTDRRTVKREISRMFSDGTIKVIDDDMVVEKRMVLEVDGSREDTVSAVKYKSKLCSLSF